MTSNLNKIRASLNKRVNSELFFRWRSKTTRLLGRYVQMKPPNQADWGEIDENNLDANWAFKQFSGKTFEEAKELFQKNALHYQEDLTSMPKPVFNFYAPALVSYLSSPLAAGDSDGASSFMHMLIWMLKKQRNILDLKTETLLVETANDIADKQDFYEADVGIYGRFSDLNEEICELARGIT